MPSRSQEAARTAAVSTSQRNRTPLIALSSDQPSSSQCRNVLNSIFLGAADRADLRQDAVRDITADQADIVGRLPLLQQVIHRLLVELRMRLLHIPALAEVEDRRPVSLRLGLFDELAVGDLRHPLLRLETLREILLGRL